MDVDIIIFFQVHIFMVKRDRSWDRTEPWPRWTETGRRPRPTLGPNGVPKTGPWSGPPNPNREPFHLNRGRLILMEGLDLIHIDKRHITHLIAVVWSRSDDQDAPPAR